MASEGSAAPQQRNRAPVQERALRTRRALLAAAEREFSERGYAATTAKTIAARAGAATGSFYQYFDSKDDVLRQIAGARHTLSVDSLSLEGAPLPADGSELIEAMRQRLRAVVQGVMHLHAADPGLHAVLSERRNADPTLDAMVSAGERLLVERIATLLGRFGHPEPAEPRASLEGDRLATAFVLFGAVEGAVHAHVLGRAVVDDARFERALVEALLRIALPVSPLPNPRRDP
jgi:AcrR family transcriptional regulator